MGRRAWNRAGKIRAGVIEGCERELERVEELEENTAERETGGREEGTADCSQSPVACERTEPKQLGWFESQRRVLVVR